MTRSNTSGLSVAVVFATAVFFVCCEAALSQERAGAQTKDAAPQGASVVTFPKGSQKIDAQPSVLPAHQFKSEAGASNAPDFKSDAAGAAVLSGQDGADQKAADGGDDAQQADSLTAPLTPEEKMRRALRLTFLSPQGYIST
ncbi:MAG: hypothetical protein ACRD68_07270, partial [Pyrinomonadaceae bacterium]